MQHVFHEKNEERNSLYQLKFWCNDMSALNIPNRLGKCQFLEETEKFLYVLNILHTKHVCLADVLTQI